MIRAFVRQIYRQRLTVEAWSDEWLEIIAASRLSPKTINDRRNYVRHINAHIGRTRVLDVRPSHIIRMMRAIEDSGRPLIARRVLYECRAMFREALHSDIVYRNPALSIEPSRPKVARSRIGIEHWIEIRAAAFEHAPPWVAPALDLALVTGQRRSDLVAMTHNDIWNERLHIAQQKTGMRIALPLTLSLDTIGLSLTDAIDACSSGPGPIIAKQNSTPYTPEALSYRFAEARDKAFARDRWSPNTPPTLHEIRSLSERLYRKQGIDTMTLLGHRTQRTTDSYNNDRWLENQHWQVLEFNRS